MIDINDAVARKLGIPRTGVAATIVMLEDGATVPFISRYRKERTGGLNEVQIREIEAAAKQFQELEKRKEYVLQTIEAAGNLTPELKKKIEEADSTTAIEDLYAPYKPKRRTRASAAREKGLEPLARIIMAGRSADPHNAAARFAGKEGVGSIDEAIAGASDIIAEWASESARLRNAMRRSLHRDSYVEVIVVKGKENDAIANYRNYLTFRRPSRHCSSHQYLAVRRAEREGIFKVKYTFDDEEAVQSAIVGAFGPKDASRPCADIIRAAASDAYKRLLRPSIENEYAAEMKEKADRDAIVIFTDNLRQLLLAAPLRGRRVLAIDPGYRTGCKVVCLDEQGNLLHDSVIYPTAPQKDLVGSASALRSLIKKYRIDVIALGNGTASRDTEQFLKEARILDPKQIFIVSENGASVYSASDLAREEFPDKDVTVRGAVSIGRRLIDPLAELVKIDPKSIGVGQYQHDVDQGQLRDALDFTVMSCVNAVGVNVNTASRQLLSYISGIGPQLASNIVAYRAEHGNFRNRRQLLKVARMGEKAFEQAAGFLRIPEGDNPLDNTGIHPESYEAVERIARNIGTSSDRLAANNELLDTIDIETVAAEGFIGAETLRDIIAELRKPGRDPRTETEEEAFNPGITDFADLHPGMIIDGVVNNITAFGAFVDLGIKENGLVHISQLPGPRRVQSPGEVLKLGQRIRVRVIETDEARRRISLSMKDLPK